MDYKINILIYGINGYIGQNIKKYLCKHNEINILYSNFDKIINKEQIVNDIETLKPDRIISCIGLVKNNTTFSTLFLNDNKYLKDNIQNNLFIHILISNICLEKNIHFTYIGTGCIFSCDKSYIFDENDEPNFFKSSYTLIKSFTDKLLSLNEKKILIIRLRQCLNDDISKQNFINKFLSYDTICDIQNSFTVIPSIFPIISLLILEKKCGKFNCVNKGSISVKEIVEIFNNDKKINIMDKNYVYENYANNILSTKNLEEFHYVEDIKEAILKLKDNYVLKLKLNL
tara:strand:+ start:2825 stop:3682 length:858 start_codon:yes stop_codon:yes gene_type:complete